MGYSGWMDCRISELKKKNESLEAEVARLNDEKSLLMENVHIQNKMYEKALAVGKGYKVKLDEAEAEVKRLHNSNIMRGAAIKDYQRDVDKLCSQLKSVESRLSRVQKLLRYPFSFELSEKCIIIDSDSFFDWHKNLEEALGGVEAEKT